MEEDRPGADPGHPAAPEKKVTSVRHVNFLERDHHSERITLRSRNWNLRRGETIRPDTVELSPTPVASAS